MQLSLWLLDEPGTLNSLTRENAEATHLKHLLPTPFTGPAGGLARKPSQKKFMPLSLATSTARSTSQPNQPFDPLPNGNNYILISYFSFTCQNLFGSSKRLHILLTFLRSLRRQLRFLSLYPPSAGALIHFHHSWGNFLASFPAQSQHTTL